MLDLEAGNGEETVNFDHKHLSKRARNCLIGGNLNIRNTLIFPEDMKVLLSSVPTNKHSIEALINPADKQNVSLATDFLATFCEATNPSQHETIVELSFRLACIADELKAFGLVIDGLLCLYAYPSLDIRTQLEQISKAIHILLVLHR